jgi:hypothetical protein
MMSLMLDDLEHIPLACHRLFLKPHDVRYTVLDMISPRGQLIAPNAEVLPQMCVWEVDFYEALYWYFNPRQPYDGREDDF